jgi:N-acetylmuramoyl-L-alanine amidase
VKGAAFVWVLLLAAAGAIACSGGGTVETPSGLPLSYGIPVEYEEPDLPYESVIPEPTPIEAYLPRPRLVVLDPGHGGDEIGAADNGIVEKHSNLDMARRVEALLAAEGVEVILTRRDDRRAALDPSLPPAGGFTPTRHDLQARIDAANLANAAVFVSIHSNGSTVKAERGVEVWFDSSRPFAQDNLRLSHLLLTNVLAELREAGYNALDRGLKDGACFRIFSQRCVSLFVLGGPRQTTVADALRRGVDPALLGLRDGQDILLSRATQMPGALVELLFISNQADAAALRNERVRDAMARGMAKAILEFLEGSEG